MELKKGDKMTGISIGIYIAIAVVVVYGLLRGLRKGLYKSLIDLGVAILSIVISVFVAKLLSKALVDEQSVLQMLDSLMAQSPDMADTLIPIKETLIGISEDSNAIGMALAFPTVLLTPLIFMVVYIAVSAILKIPKLILARSIFGKNGGETYRGGNRPFGGAIGAVARLVSFAVFIVPVIGYIMLTSNTMLAFGEASMREVPSSSVQVMSDEYVEGELDVELDSEQEQTPEADTAQGASMVETLNSIGQGCLQARDTAIAPVADNPVVKIIHTCGGKWLFDSLTSAKIEGEKVTLSEEIDSLVNIYSEAVVLLKVPTREYGDAQVEAVDNIADTMGSTKIVPTIISSLLSYTAETWLEGGEVFGAPKIIVGEYYEPTLDKILVMFSQTTNQTIDEDIHTIGGIVDLCIKEGTFVEISNGTPLNIAKNEEFMGGLFVALYENDRMRPLVGDLINSFKNYIYRVYNDVNGTSIPYPVQIQMEELGKETVYAEGKLIASIVNDFSTFYGTVDPNETDNTKFLIQTDVRSLGKALDKVEQSVFLGDSYSFLLEAVLRSEGARQFAFITPDFVESIVNRKTSMETVLVARQQIAIILTATKAENRDDAIKHILENVDPESADVIKETLTPEVLKEFGMNSDEAHAMSNTLGSIIDQIAANDGNLTDEQMQKEIDAVGSIVGVVQGATSSEEDNLFSAEEGDYSKSDMSAGEFVATVVESQIISEAVNEASTDENGNLVEDPYKIAGKLTETDKEEAKSAIEDYYANSTVEGADKEELKGTLGSLANIFGVDVSLE